ncbi:MAG: DUF3892 domain-containing protein [Anaerolineae bacterium]|nr:DUF3892 domain-containing protein [Anaerolineae bacterium]
MMEKLIITAVQFDEARQRLVYVFVGLPPDNADRTVDGMRLYTRDQLIRALDNGKRFVTAYQERGSWHFGGDVHLIETDGKFYLRTDNARIPVDDLGNLAKIRASL